MKVVFVAQNCIPVHAYTLSERPLGGTETALIRLAEALSDLGAQVYVFTEHSNPPLSNPLFLPLRALGDIGPIDVLIAVRDWQTLLLPLKAKKKLFWTGDAYDQPISIGIGDVRVAEEIDVFCAVSKWQAETTCQHSGFPLEKTYILRNGVHLSYFNNSPEISKDPYRLIYSSTPFRGLRLIPEIYRRLKKIHPQISLHIFSGFGVYAGIGQAAEAQAEFVQLKKELSELPDCRLEENIKQEELALEMLKSGILLYPNTFAETSCITAMEAQAAGCVVISSHLGALPETVAESGVLLKAEPHSEQYTGEFVQACSRILSNPQEFQALSQSARLSSESSSWKTIGSKFLGFLQELTQKP